MISLMNVRSSPDRVFVRQVVSEQRAAMNAGRLTQNRSGPIRLQDIPVTSSFPRASAGSIRYNVIVIVSDRQNGIYERIPYDFYTNDIHSTSQLLDEAKRLAGVWVDLSPRNHSSRPTLPNVKVDVVVVSVERRG